MAKRIPKPKFKAGDTVTFTIGSGDKASTGRGLSKGTVERHILHNSVGGHLYTVRLSDRATYAKYEKDLEGA